MSLQTLSRLICLQCRLTSRITFRKYYSSLSPGPPPPLLSRLRDDLKTALKSKDKARLNVLRSLLADITNSQKAGSPIKDDNALLVQLRKRIGSAQDAAKQAADVSRPDLVEKEKEQIDILEQYAGNIKTMPEEEIRSIIEGIVTQLEKDAQPLTSGNILKKCFGSVGSGAFEGRIVDRATVVKMVKELSK
jgi:uncharacterized protein YqeY